MNTSWRIKGSGPGVHVTAECPRCKQGVTIAPFRSNAVFRHCGEVEQIPDNVIEQAARRTQESYTGLDRFRVRFL